MYRIKIFSVGKTKETWLQGALDEYLKRLKPIASLEFVWAKTDLQLEELVFKEKTPFCCLDPEGLQLTSQEFSDFLHQKLEEGHSRFGFVIGGAEGLSSLLKKGQTLVSLSPLTFTHQLTRLILIEQIYRAFEIAKGSHYHK